MEEYSNIGHHSPPPRLSLSAPLAPSAQECLPSLTDIPGELAKRISRRQFLFGGTNRGGGGSEAGVIGAVLGTVGIGVGVMALGSPGADAKVFTDKYATIASLNSRLNVDIVDEFLGGSTETGEIGFLGWESFGTVTLASISESNHPGGIRISANNNQGGIRLANNSISLADPWDLTWIVKAVLGTTSMRVKIGPSSAIDSSPATAEIVFSFEDSLSPNWLAQVVQDDSSLIQEDTGIAYALGWWVLRIVRLPAKIDFYINDVLTNTIDDNEAVLPTTAGEFSVLDQSKVALNKQVLVDFLRAKLVVTR